MLIDRIIFNLNSFRDKNIALMSYVLLPVALYQMVSNSSDLKENMTIVDASKFFGSCVFAFILERVLMQGSVNNLYMKRQRHDSDNSYNTLENVKDVVIKDLDGLEMILNQTAKGILREWGTYISAVCEGDTAIITYLMPLTEAEEDHSVKGRSFNTSTGDALEAYDGVMHYHPSWVTRFLSAFNYRITSRDRRNTKMNSINLLTFNTGKGPELIAFNKKFVYIPKYESDKSHLVMATPNDIRAYIN